MALIERRISPFASGVSMERCFFLSASYFCLFRTTFAGFMPSICPFISSPDTLR